MPLLIGYDLLTRREPQALALPRNPFVVCAGITLVYLNTVGGRYLYVIYTEHGLREALALAPFAAGDSGGGGAAGFFYARRVGGGYRRLARSQGPLISLCAALCVAAVALWAYFVWPVHWESSLTNPGTSTLTGPRSWFATWFDTRRSCPGAGRVRARRAGSTSFRGLVLGAFLGFGVLYAVIPNVSPDLPWATRRFVPPFCLFRPASPSRWEVDRRGVEKGGALSSEVPSAYSRSAGPSTPPRPSSGFPGAQGSHRGF